MSQIYSLMLHLSALSTIIRKLLIHKIYPKVLNCMLLIKIVHFGLLFSNESEDALSLEARNTEFAEGSTTSCDKHLK